MATFSITSEVSQNHKTISVFSKAFKNVSIPYIQEMPFNSNRHSFLLNRSSNPQLRFQFSQLRTQKLANIQIEKKNVELLPIMHCINIRNNSVYGLRYKDLKKYCFKIFQNSAVNELKLLKMSES